MIDISTIQDIISLHQRDELVRMVSAEILMVSTYRGLRTDEDNVATMADMYCRDLERFSPTLTVADIKAVFDAGAHGQLCADESFRHLSADLLHRWTVDWKKGRRKPWREPEDLPRTLPQIRAENEEQAHIQTIERMYAAYKAGRAAFDRGERPQHGNVRPDWQFDGERLGEPCWDFTFSNPKIYPEARGTYCRIENQRGHQGATLRECFERRYLQDSFVTAM